MNTALVNHIHKYPDFKWNFDILSSNPYVTLATLKKFEHADWNYTTLSKHPNFSWNWVRELPSMPWDMRILIEHPNFSWNWVCEFPNRNWNWHILSQKINDIEIVKKFPDKPWNWYILTLCNQIGFNDMLHNPNLPWLINELLFTVLDDDNIEFLRYYRSHYDSISWYDHTARASWKIIKNNLDLPWVISEIRFSSNDEFEIDDIQYLYSLHGWNMKHLSEMLDFKTIIMNTPDLKWDYKLISKNKSVTYRDVNSTPQWDLHFINLDLHIKETRAANIIKKQWKESITNPAHALCRRIVLTDLNETIQKITSCK